VRRLIDAVIERRNAEPNRRHPYTLVEFLTDAAEHFAAELGLDETATSTPTLSAPAPASMVSTVRSRSITTTPPASTSRTPKRTAAKSAGSTRKPR